MNMFNRNKKMVKVVTLVLLQVFLGWNISSAAVSDRSMWQQRGKASVLITGSSVSGNSLEQENLQKSIFSEFFVPENAGTINELWVPAGMSTKEALSSSKLLIHIRDAHCNYEAQGNIAKIIDNFTKSNNLNFVAVEGAQGKIDYSALNAYSNYDVRRNVSDYFMELGRVDGAEFSNINADKYFTLYGAEKSDVYNSNLQHFRQNLKYKEDGMKFVGQVKSALGTLKAQMYTPELKDLEEKLALYNNREISFVDYCQYLYNLPAAQNVRTGYKNFALLMNAIKTQELVDFSQVETEKDALVAQISKNASAAELMTLSKNSLDFRMGKISTVAYYNSLDQLATEKKVDLASYKNLKPYMLYLNIYEKINSAELFKEKDTLEAEVKRTLFKNTDQARLDKLSKNAEILEKIYSVRLTNDDLSYFKNNRSDFTAYEFQNFINAQAPKYNLTVNVDFKADPLEKFLPSFEAFYNEAKTRDDLLVQNALSQMDAEGTKVGVLVAGGFHTPGMTAYLRSKNIPYMVVTPRILKEDVNNPYLKLIAGENLPVEKLLSLEHLFTLHIPVKPGATKETLEAAMKLADPRNADAQNGAARVEILNGVPYLIVKAAKDLNAEQRKETANAAVATLAAKNIAIEIDPNSPADYLDGTNVVKKALKGPKAAAQNETLIVQAIKAGDVNVVPVATLTAGEFGRRVASIVPLLQQIFKVNGNDVKVVSPKDAAKYPYEGLPLATLTTAQAVQDQDNGRVVKVDGNDEAVVSQRTLARLLARAELASPAQADVYKKIAAALVAHEALIKAGNTDVQAIQQADKIALANTPFEGLRLSDVFDFLDLKGGSTEELVTAQGNLAKATDKFISEPNAENALLVVEAELALRAKVNANTTSEVARAKDDLNLVGSLVSSGFLGVDVANGKLVRSPSVPNPGEQPAEAVTTTLPASLTKLFTDRGISSVVVQGETSPAAKAQVLANLLGINGKVSLKDAIALNNGVQGAIALLVTEAPGQLRLVIQSTTANADLSAAIASAAIAAPIPGVASESNELLEYALDADAAVKNDATLDSLRATIATFLKNNSVTFTLTGKPENVSKVRGQISAALAKKLTTDETRKNVKRTITVVVGDLPAGAKAEDYVLIKPDAANQVAAFHLAVPLSYLTITGLFAQEEALVKTLLSEQYGITDAKLIDAKYKEFVDSKGKLSLPGVSKFEINLSLKLAIAA